MPTIKLQSGKVVTKGGKPSCACCGPSFEMSIKYDWSGTGQFDLDTSTTAFGESVGWSCGDSGTYVLWLPGGDPYSPDDQGQDGFERVDVRVDLARVDGLWTSSYNVECFAGWYSSALGSGDARLEVIYKGVTKTKAIAPGSQSGCASTPVATITVYASPLGDGSFFEII